jgi:hypothetical protein
MLRSHSATNTEPIAGQAHGGAGKTGLCQLLASVALDNGHFRKFFSAFILNRSLPDLCPSSARLSRVLGLEDFVQLLESSAFCLNPHQQIYRQHDSRPESGALPYEEEVYESELEKVPEHEKDIKPVSDL